LKTFVINGKFYRESKNERIDVMIY